MEYNHNGGGRPSSHAAPDCVTRALTIVTGSTYATVTEYLKPLMTAEGVNVFSPQFATVASFAGLIYFNATAKGFKVSDLPTHGVYIAHTSGHVSAIVDGVVQDTFDTREDEIMGYWLPISKKGYGVYKGAEGLNTHPLGFNDAVRMASLYSLNYSRDELLTVRPNL